jgi:hypothetical protein
MNMHFTEKQIAHVLAALRLSHGKDLSAMPHFDATGPPLNDAEIDELCEDINCGKGHELQADSGLLKPYTVVGLFPQCDWDGSVRDASFVEFVEATSPYEAARSARILAARNRLVYEQELPENEFLKEAEKQGFQIETLAVFEGHIPDLYDPEGASPSD